MAWWGGKYGKQGGNHGSTKLAILEMPAAEEHEELEDFFLHVDVCVLQGVLEYNVEKHGRFGLEPVGSSLDGVKQEPRYSIQERSKLFRR